MGKGVESVSRGSGFNPQHLKEKEKEDYTQGSMVMSVMLNLMGQVKFLSEIDHF